MLKQEATPFQRCRLYWKIELTIIATIQSLQVTDLFAAEEIRGE